MVAVGMGAHIDIMWSRTGGTVFFIYTECLDVPVLLTFITSDWFLHIFDYYNSGVGNENPP